MIVPGTFVNYLMRFDPDPGQREFPFLEVVGYINIGCDFNIEAGGGSLNYMLLDMLYSN